MARSASISSFIFIEPISAVMAWRHTLSCTSPQAKTPSTLVWVVPGTVAM